MGKVEEVPLNQGGMVTKTFPSGIMIKLSDGLMLAIHGGLIRHGSTLPFPDGEAFLKMNPYMKKNFGSPMLLKHPPKRKNTVYGEVEQTNHRRQLPGEQLVCGKR